jgi:hypothetical protein
MMDQGFIVLKITVTGHSLCGISVLTVMNCIRLECMWNPLFVWSVFICHIGGLKMSFEAVFISLHYFLT